MTAEPPHPAGKWAHVPIVSLVEGAGIPLTPRKGGREYSGGHPHRHDSKSGTCLVVWPESGRWYCSSCEAKGDAADFLVDVGQAETRDAGEQILTSRFGPPPISTKPHLTDLGNAQRLVNTYGDRLRYCWNFKKWMFWNGKNWQLDEQGQVFLFAKDVIKEIYQEAAGLAQWASQVTEEDARVRLANTAEALVKWARKSESRDRINAMVDLARSEPGIPVNPDQLDSYLWLLNVANGILDLHTGKLRPHDSTKLITKLIKVPYRPKATCPIWEAFLYKIMGGNENLVRFLQRMIGYALTGDVSEQVFFILYGTGANGKSTFINTFLELLGEFAVKATAELLMVKRGESHPTERTRLFGTRFVATIETAANQPLDETLVKELTGGDPITARRMREDFWTFPPTHKIFLATNHKPVIRGSDHAIWRRVRLISFSFTIPDGEQDKSLPQKLKVEFPGILAWAVRGCLEWQLKGLGIPDEVQLGTEEYRADMDLLGQFISDCCQTGPAWIVGATELYSRFEAWGHEQGMHRPWTQATFGRSLSERGMKKRREPGTGRRQWLGLRLRDFNTECEQFGVHTEIDFVNSLEPGFVAEKGSVNSCEPDSGLNGSEALHIEVNRKSTPNCSQPFTEVSTDVVITSVDQARKLVKFLAQKPFIGLDTETTGVDPHRDQVRLVQLSLPDQCWVIDTFRVPLEVLRPVLEGGPTKIAQNAKFDWQFFRQAGISMYPVFDTMLADQVIYNRNFGRGLDVLCKEYLGIEVSKELQKSDWTGPLTEQQIEYARRDALVLPDLATALSEKLRQLGLVKVVNIESAALPAVALMEFQGVRLDLDSWQLLAETAEGEVKELENELGRMIKASKGEVTINWRSTKQVIEALNQLGVSVSDTKQETLERVQASHPILPVLLNYREVCKRASTYGMEWTNHMNTETGRIHPDWRQIGAESGRMACQRPNLQNLPKRKDYRDCFRPLPGNVFIRADYNQIELRLAAVISGDQNMIEAFHQINDLHDAAAAQITGKPIDQVTHDERELAKAVNYGLIYGMGPTRLAAQAGSNYSVTLTEAEATGIRDRYFQKFSGLRRWHQRQSRKASTRTLLGRRRTWKGKPPFTQLINTPIQGSGADGLKHALALLWDRRDQCPGAFPVLAIHDEIIIEAPTDQAEAAQEWLAQCMKDGMSPMLGAVPVAVEAVLKESYG